MVRRKGELSAAEIDRHWPHQVALPADQCTGRNYEIHRVFCRELSLCLRGHTVRYADRTITYSALQMPHMRICFARRSVVNVSIPSSGAGESLVRVAPELMVQVLQRMITPSASRGHTSIYFGSFREIPECHRVTKLLDRWNAVLPFGT